MSLMSHSCHPNCVLEMEGGRRAVMRTMSDVPAGEELTWSYGAVTESAREAKSMRCLCTSCRKMERSTRALLYMHKAISAHEWRRNLFELVKAVAMRCVSDEACRALGFCGDPMFEALASWQKRYVALMARKVGRNGDVEGLWRLVELLSAHALCHGGVAQEPFFSVERDGDGYTFEVVDYTEDLETEVSLDGGAKMTLEKGYAAAICVLWHTCKPRTPVKDMMKGMENLVLRRRSLGRPRGRPMEARREGV